MSDASQYPPLASIEREMAAGHLWPVFSRQIERLYRSEAACLSARPVVTPWLIGIVLFDMFLASDYVVAPKDFIIYAVFRLLIVTPACLTVLVMAVRHRSAYQALISAMPVLMSAALAFLLVTLHGSYRADYMFGNILILICGCIINRSPLAYAIVSVLLQCAMFHTILFGSDIVSSGGRLLHSLFCISGAVVALITSYTLETDRRQTFLLGLRVRLLNRELEAVAMTDPLTGLANRRRLADVTECFWVKQPAISPLASIILIDVDHFKMFNDQQGHMAGDVCLETIARRVCLQLRCRDLAVRFGGEEILVFLPDTGFDAARQVADAICGSIRAAQIPHPALGKDAFVTASLGVHTGNTRDCTVDELIASADTALYAAKAAGRNCIWPPIRIPSADQDFAAETCGSRQSEHDGKRAHALA